jgi:hypothetical protein
MKEAFEFKMLRRGAVEVLPGKSSLKPARETCSLTNPVVEEVRSLANGTIYEKSYRN